MTSSALDSVKVEEKSWLPVSTPAAVAFVVLSALVSVCFPLAAYTLSLAVFGLAHVLTELRYLDGRFGGRLARTIRIAIGVLLLAVVVVRVLRVTDVLTGDASVTTELLLVLGLIGVVVPSAFAHSPRRGAVVLVGAAAIGLGLTLSPTHALLAMAVLHNATPAGFLDEALSGAERRRARDVSMAVFVVIPLIIASGVPYAAAAALGLGYPEADVLSAGTLSQHLTAYLPKEWRGEAFAQHAFAAVVFTQLMHYAAVIHVLPHLLERDGYDAAAGVAGPGRFVRTTGYAVALVLGGVVLFAFFTRDFSAARGIYGIAAAVHAWVEAPLLLLFVGAAGDAAGGAVGDATGQVAGRA